VATVEQSYPPVVTSIDAGSPADRAGVIVGDLIVAVNGEVPRDIIEWHLQTSESEVMLSVSRAGIEVEIEVLRSPGEEFGVHVESAVFDRVRTCDNHCDFCFIYQLPKGLRQSLYLKDDDYRLSFLYGNFTTLTRFTEADLERVIAERISPLNVSIHSTDPQLRARMLRNERGSVSLRWMKEMLKAEIDIRGQIVLCPDVNDAEALDRTLGNLLNEYSQIESIAIVPLGLSRFNPENHLRVHRQAEAVAVIEQVERWRDTFTKCVGRPTVFAADEFYIVANRPWPEADHYGDFAMYEDGIGMVRQLQMEFAGHKPDEVSSSGNFFRSADTDHRYGDSYDANPAADTGLRRALKIVDVEEFNLGSRRVILTALYGAHALREVVPNLPEHVRIATVENEFFGGNTAVTGLMVGSDINRVLANCDEDETIFLPDVCLSGDRFLDGLSLKDLIRPVKIVRTDGRTLKRIIEA